MNILLGLHGQHAFTDGAYIQKFADNWFKGAKPLREGTGKLRNSIYHWGEVLSVMSACWKTGPVQAVAIADRQHANA